MNTIKKRARISNSYFYEKNEMMHVILSTLTASSPLVVKITLIHTKDEQFQCWIHIYFGFLLIQPWIWRATLVLHMFVFNFCLEDTLLDFYGFYGTFHVASLFLFIYILVLLLLLEQFNYQIHKMLWCVVLHFLLKFTFLLNNIKFRDVQNTSSWKVFNSSLLTCGATLFARFLLLLFHFIGTCFWYHLSLMFSLFKIITCINQAPRTWMVFCILLKPKS